MNKCLSMCELFKLDEEALKEITKNSKTAKSMFDFFNKSMMSNLDDEVLLEDKSNKRKYKK